MTPSSIAKIVLPTVLNLKVKPLLNDETQNKYFPKSLDAQIYDEIRTLSKTIEEVKNEIARLRIQPPIHAFNMEIDYYTNFVISTIRREFKKGNSKSKPLIDLASEIDTHCKKFSGEINNSWQIIDEKADSCDFAVRTLFLITRDMCGLYLAMLSWAHGLYTLLEDSDKVEAYNEYIEKCLKQVPSNCAKYSAKLNDARLGKIKFESKIDTDTEYDSSTHLNRVKAKKVYCFYEDSFSSSEQNDPFKGDKIYYKIDKEYGFWPWNPGEPELVMAWDYATKYAEEHKNHKEIVQKLAYEHIIKPNDEFMKIWENTKLEKLNNFQ